MTPPDPDHWQRATTLFDELVELDADARGERLRALSAAEPALARAVRAMLEADAQSGGMLDRGVGQAAPTVLEGLTRATDGSDESGRTIGAFRLVRLLARGGMGEVYLAERSVGDMRQLVAIKLLKRGMDSDVLLRRFAQERRILAQLSHPHIARFLDGGVSADGRPYFAMEYVDGADLIQHARVRGLDVRARVALLASVCDAVAYAHSRLVVHRDLKPSNIFVDANEQPRVLDFGIAKLLTDSEDGTLTGTGARVMSPAYAAPEQILGEPIGTTTDVYALGVVLFELLTGVLPHRRARGSAEALARGLGDESIERPSEVVRSARGSDVTGMNTSARTQRGRLARELASDLDTIVLTALKREPERRYATASALADDLRRWLGGRPIAARPDTTAYRLAKFVRRHRGGVVASLLTLLALLGGLGLALWQAEIARGHAARADAEAQRAERESVAARAALDRSKRVKDFLISVFLQEDPLRRDARGALTMAEAFEDAKARIDSELADDPVLRVDLLDDFGEIIAGKGDFEGARKMFERALALAEETHGPRHPAVAESLVNMAVIASYQGRILDGEAWLERAVAIYEPHQGSEPFGLANALAALANVRREQGRAPDAVDLLRRQLGIERRARAADDPPIQPMQNLATALGDLHRDADAEPLLRESMAAIETKFGAGSAQLIPSLWTLELILYRQNRLAEESAAVERRLALARATFADDHPWVAGALAASGEVLARDGKRETGEARIREGIAMYERLGRPNMPAWRLLAQTQAREGEDAAALVSAETGWEICKGSGEVASQSCLSTRALRAGLLARNGRAAEALEEADRVLEALARGSPERTGKHAEALEARAAALQRQGRVEEAIAAQREALSISTALYGAEHIATRDVRRRLDALGRDAD